MYILLKTHTNFYFISKDDFDKFHITLEMDKSVVHIFTLSMDSVKVVNSYYINFEIWKFHRINIRFNKFLKQIFNIKHVKLDTSEPAVHWDVTIPASDSSARAIVLVVHQNAILRLAAGKKVIHVYSVYVCVLWTNVVYLRVVFYYQRMHFSGFARKVSSNFCWS